MSGPRERANLWLERNRPDLAEPELRKALAEDPDDGEAHTLLALCLIQLEKYNDGLAEAEQGCSLNPDEPLPHYVRAEALIGLDRPKDAEAAAQAAIQIDPEFTPAFSALSRAFGQQRRWKSALQAAENGLELDPESDDCANDRATALIQLGDAEQAEFSLQAALQRDPDDPRTHANLGYSALHRGDAQDAITHYREALRLDPTDAFARAGLVEALKSRNLIYRLFLKFFLGLTRVPGWVVLVVLIGSVLLRQGLSDLAERFPAWSPLLMGAFWLIVAFVLMSWIAVPLFNLLLRLDRDGKHALKPEQIRITNWLAGMLVLFGGVCTAWIAGVPSTGFASFALGLLILPVLAFLSAGTSRQRWITGAFVATLFLSGAGMVVADTQVTDDPRLRALLKRMTPEQLELPLGKLLLKRPTNYSTDEWLEVSEGLLRFMGESKWRGRRDTCFDIFLWGFVAFTWIGGGSLSAGRRD